MTGFTITAAPISTALTAYSTTASMNSLMNSAISNNAIARDGTSPPMADIGFSGFKATGLANGTIATDAATKGQLDALAFGVNQSWINVTASRALATNYTNSTVKPIIVSTRVTAGITPINLKLTTDTFVTSECNVLLGQIACVTSIVDPGSTYSVSASAGTLTSWYEYS